MYILQALQKDYKQKDNCLFFPRKLFLQTLLISPRFSGKLKGDSAKPAGPGPDMSLANGKWKAQASLASIQVPNRQKARRRMGVAVF